MTWSRGWRAAAVAAALLGLGACTPTPTTPTTPTTPSAPAPQPVQLLWVVDGDTIDVQIGNEQRRVRILGIDTPERDECGHDDATNRLNALLTDATLTLSHDPAADQEDQYGRLLGYLDVDEHDIGLILINEGLAAAWWPRSAPTPARGPAYQEAQYAAEDAGIGSGEHCDQVGRRRSD